MDFTYLYTAFNSTFSKYLLNSYLVLGAGVQL